MMVYILKKEKQVLKSLCFSFKNNKGGLKENKIINKI